MANGFWYRYRQYRPSIWAIPAHIIVYRLLISAIWAGIIVLGTSKPDTILPMYIRISRYLKPYLKHMTIFQGEPDCKTFTSNLKIDNKGNYLLPLVLFYLMGGTEPAFFLKNLTFLLNLQ